MLLKKFFYIIWVMVVAGCVVACNTNSRKSTKIPPLPSFDDNKRILRSIEFLTDAINKSPRAALNYQKRAELYSQQENWNDALTDINQALEISPGNGAFLISRAKILRQLKRYDQALKDARRAEVSTQNSPELYVVLGDLMQQNKQYNQGKLYLAKALQMSPYDGEAYYYTGLITAKQGDTLTGISLIDEGIALKPRFLEAYVTLTDIYTRLYNYDMAMHYNKIGLRYFPKEAPLYYSRGLMYHNRGVLDSALHSYSKVFLLDSKNYMANYQTGLIYMKWRNYPMAARYFERVVKINPKFPKIHSLLGIAFDKAGNINRALDECKLAMQFEPYDYHIKNLVARLTYKKDYFEKYGFYPTFKKNEFTDDSTDIQEELVPQKTIDTTRIIPLKPRLEINTRKDTSRTIKLKQ